MSRLKVIILNGPVGVGKTSVSEAISEILQKNSIPHAYIDFDNLTQSFPRPKNDPFNYSLGMKNLSDLWNNYKKLNIKYLILPHVVGSRDELKDYKNAIPEGSFTVVGLRADIKTLHSRLKQRNSGDSLKWHLNRAKELTKQFDKNKVDDFTMDTDRKTVAEVAAIILNKIDTQGKP